MRRKDKRETFTLNLTLRTKYLYIDRLVVPFASLLILLCVEIPSALCEARDVTIGVYENAPKVFTSESGKPSGIFMDVIEYIAKKEGWRLHYVSGSWAEGLDRLAKGEIDFMPDVAYTSDREKKYSFHKVSVLSSWSQVYASKGNGIKSILDLNGKRIAVLQHSIQQSTFDRLATGFGLSVKLVPVADIKTMFDMVSRGEADAAVTNRFYGLMHAKKMGLEDTAIVFDPSELFFAAPKNASDQLMDAVDKHLSELKKNPQSEYYESLKRWTSEKVQFELPAWTKIIGLVLGVCLIMSIAGSFFLKHKVNLRTRELEQRNADLRASEHRYRQLFEQNPAPVLIYERGTLEILAVNEAFKEHYGYSAEQALSLRLTDLYPEEERGSITELAARLKGSAYVGEWHHLKADGSTIAIVARSHDIDYFNHDARIAVISDITERVKMETALRQSEEKFFKAFHATPDAIVISRAEDGLLLEVNGVFLAMSEFSRDEVLNRTVLELGLWVEVNDRKRYLEVMKEHGRVRDMEARFRMKSGKVLDGLISGENMVLGGEKCLLTIIRDVTERKKTEAEIEKYRLHLEEMVGVRTAELEKSRETLREILEDMAEAKAELETANERLKELDRLKSLFIASMSHELRTPLNSIIGFTGILLQKLPGPLNDEQMRQLGMVKGSAQHLLELIMDIIDLSKLEAGKMDISPAEFDLMQVVREVTAMLGEAAGRKNVSLHLDGPETCGIKSDKRRVRQVLVNIVGNAVKFTSAGEVRVSLSGDYDAARVTVKDSGPGIRAEDMGKLFQFFSRITSPDMPAHEGTGLGLYLSKKLMTLLGGDITAESEFGKGSSFTMVLPIRIKEAP